MSNPLQRKASVQERFPEANALLVYRLHSERKHL
jgi:hypothetical protein